MAAALSNAQTNYANARQATPAEFDDLFAAAGVVYNGAETASSGFATGGGIIIAQHATVANLKAILGGVGINSQQLIWTDPDESDSTASTRDWIDMRDDGILAVIQSTAHVRQVTLKIGWLLVSDLLGSGLEFFHFN